MVMPNAGRMTTSSGVKRVERFARVAQKADALRAKLIVDVRVVDDLAGQEDRAIGKALPRLIRVVDGAVHAVAEAEFPREVDGETAGRETVVRRLDRRDELAVITLGEHVRDFVLEVEAFSEDEGALGHRRVTARGAQRRSTDVPRARRQGVQRSERGGSDTAGRKLDLAEQLVVRDGRSSLRARHARLCPRRGIDCGCRGMSCARCSARSPRGTTRRRPRQRHPSAPGGRGGGAHP